MRRHIGLGVIGFIGAVSIYILCREVLATFSGAVSEVPAVYERYLTLCVGLAGAGTMLYGVTRHGHMTFGDALKGGVLGVLAGTAATVVICYISIAHKDHFSAEAQKHFYLTDVLPIVATSGGLVGCWFYSRRAKRFHPSSKSDHCPS